MDRPESLESALDEALDALVSGDPEAARRVRQRYSNASEVTGLMDAAGRVRTALSATPSPQAQARHLAMIREAAAKAAKEAPQKRWKPFAAPRVLRGTGSFQRFLLKPVLVVGLALVLAAPAALALSARALPGDPLYSTKLAFENVRLAMARDPEKVVDLHVQFAQRRISELNALTDHGLPDQAAIAPVLDSLQAHQDEAVQGVDALKQEGKPVGLIGERVAVTLQQNTTKLMTIRTDTGCNPDGSDPRCAVIATAVNLAEQALAKVGEEPSGTGALAAPPRSAPSRGGRNGGRGRQAPSGPGGGQQPGTQPGAQPGGQGEQGAQGLEPSPNAPGATNEPSAPPVSPVPGNGEVVPPPRVTVSPSPPPVQNPPDVLSGGEFVPVTIDIKPFDGTNTLDIVNRTDLPVVVKATPGFDPATLDISSICFGRDPSDPTRSDCHAQGRLFGLPGGGRPDLILVFKMADTGIRAGDTEACLTGRTKDGKTLVKGCDKVSVVAVTPSSAPPTGGTVSPTPEAGALRPGRITTL